MDRPAAEPPAGHAAPHAKRAQAAVEPEPVWPVLARIAEVGRVESLSSQPTYRLDSPHRVASPPLQHSLMSKVGAQRASKAPADGAKQSPRDEQVLAAMPLPIRMMVQAWRLVHPYRSLIRTAVMFALMAVGGMSMMMILGDDLRELERPAGDSSTAADQATAVDTGAKSVEVLHPLEASEVPDADAKPDVPTAQGPAPVPSEAVMAIESTQVGFTPAYPTTPYPEATLPQVDDDPLPRVRISEPAIARLRGQLPETTSR